VENQQKISVQKDVISSLKKRRGERIIGEERGCDGKQKGGRRGKRGRGLGGKKEYKKGIPANYQVNSKEERKVKSPLATELYRVIPGRRRANPCAVKREGKAKNNTRPDHRKDGKSIRRLKLKKKIGSYEKAPESLKRSWFTRPVKQKTGEKHSGGREGNGPLARGRRAGGGRRAKA